MSKPMTTRERNQFHNEGGMFGKRRPPKQKRRLFNVTDDDLQRIEDPEFPRTCRVCQHLGFLGGGTYRCEGRVGHPLLANVDASLKCSLHQFSVEELERQRKAESAVFTRMTKEERRVEARRLIADENLPPEIADKTVEKILLRMGRGDFNPAKLGDFILSAKRAIVPLRELGEPFSTIPPGMEPQGETQAPVTTTCLMCHAELGKRPKGTLFCSDRHRKRYWHLHKGVR